MTYSRVKKGLLSLVLACSLLLPLYSHVRAQTDASSCDTNPQCGDGSNWCCWKGGQGGGYLKYCLRETDQAALRN
jgi:hypothetical protein